MDLHTSLESLIGSNQDTLLGDLAWPDWPGLLKVKNEPCSTSSLAAKACPSQYPASKKDTNDLLYLLAISSIEGCSGVRFSSILGSGTIYGTLPGVWGMLGAAGVLVMKAEEGTVNISWHGEVDSAVGIIPVRVSPQYLVASQFSVTL